jgi:hypothetical protein
MKQLQSLKIKGQCRSDDRAFSEALRTRIFGNALNGRSDRISPNAFSPNRSGLTRSISGLL